MATKKSYSGLHTDKNRRYVVASEKNVTTSKKIVWFLLINGILWVWASYLLAYLGKDQIAESLSSTICTVILGDVIGYFIKSTIENISKYTDIFMKSARKEGDIHGSDAAAGIPDAREPDDVGTFKF